MDADNPWTIVSSFQHLGDTLFLTSLPYTEKSHSRKTDLFAQQQIKSTILIQSFLIKYKPGSKHYQKFDESLQQKKSQDKPVEKNINLEFKKIQGMYQKILIYLTYLQD